MNNTYEEMKNIFERSVIYISSQSVYAYVKTGKIKLFNKKNIMIYLDYDDYENIAKPMKGKDFISRWLKDDRKKTILTADYYPPPLPCPKNVLNLWSGFAIETFTPKLPVSTESDNVKYILNYIYNLLNKDEIGYEYVLDWMATMFQAPGTKSGSMLILKCGKGACKNLLNLLNLMIGDDLYFESPYLDCMLRRYSFNLRGRMLIHIKGDGCPLSTYTGKLSSFITDPTHMCKMLERPQTYPAVSTNCFARVLHTELAKYGTMLHNAKYPMKKFEISTEFSSFDIDNKLNELINTEHIRYEFYLYLTNRCIL